LEYDDSIRKRVFSLASASEKLRKKHSSTFSCPQPSRDRDGKPSSGIFSSNRVIPLTKNPPYGSFG
jgi:hypothetical protein